MSLFSLSLNWCSYLYTREYKALPCSFGFNLMYETISPVTSLFSCESLFCSIFSSIYAYSIYTLFAWHFRIVVKLLLTYATNDNTL